MRYLVIVLMIVAILLINATAYFVLPRTQAQPINTTSMATLLSQLETSGTPFTVQFRESVPLLGASTPVGPGERATIESIGVDVVCFRVTGQTNELVQCAPYANVASLVYTRQ